MNNFKSNEIRGVFIVTGFLAGLLLTLFIQVLIIKSLDEVFTFQVFLRNHKSFQLLFVVDAFPLLGALLGYLLAKSRIDLMHIIEETNEHASESSKYITSVIHDLTVGNLSTRIKDDVIDKEMSLQLKSMQSRLKENLNTQKATREADQQRNWTSHGLAEFGDLLRSHSSDLELLAYSVISHLVRYMQINQGGFFTVNKEEEKPYLDLIACHAYDRKKFPNQKINWGEGLIGAVAIEKKSYYTNKIPDGYLTISSGLGRANPRHLLIVPLVLNDEVFGVFELASFDEIQDYKIQFVERVAENTATTLNILMSNTRTEQLLKETQEQASMLVLQEEKVRQNIEELKLTQAEAAKQSEQFISFTNTVNHTLIRAEYDSQGKLIYANTRFLKKLGYSGNREVEGKDISFFIHSEDKEWFSGIWNRLAAGGEHFEGYMRHITKMGLDLWTMATYTCVRKDDGSVAKILFLSIDSTDQKEKSLYFEGQIKAINRINPKAEFTPDGRLFHYNDLFLDTLKFNKKDVENKNIFDFFARNDQERINEIWEQVIKGSAFQGQLMMLGKYEEEVWFRATFTTVDDMYGEAAKIVFLAYEITKEKELELSMHKQNARLKEKEDEIRLQTLDLRRQLDKLLQDSENDKQMLRTELKKYMEILDKHPQPVLVANNQGIIQLLNKAASKIWKTPRKSLSNSGLDVLFHRQQEDSVIQAFIEPGKRVIEVSHKTHSLILPDHTSIERNISIFITEAGSEEIQTLIIHEV